MKMMMMIMMMMMMRMMMMMMMMGTLSWSCWNWFLQSATEDCSFFFCEEELQLMRLTGAPQVLALALHQSHSLSFLC